MQGEKKLHKSKTLFWKSIHRQIKMTRSQGPLSDQRIKTLRFIHRQ